MVLNVTVVVRITYFSIASTDPGITEPPFGPLLYRTPVASNSTAFTPSDQLVIMLM